MCPSAKYILQSQILVYLTMLLGNRSSLQDLHNENVRLVGELSLLEQEKENVALEGEPLFIETNLAIS